MVQENTETKDNMDGFFDILGQDTDPNILPGDPNNITVEVGDSGRHIIGFTLTGFPDIKIYREMNDGERDEEFFERIKQEINERALLLSALMIPLIAILATAAPLFYSAANNIDLPSFEIGGMAVLATICYRLYEHLVDLKSRYRQIDFVAKTLQTSNTISFDADVAKQRLQDVGDVSHEETLGYKSVSTSIANTEQ
ncbi:MAG: hypothetical protein Q9M91_01910 [Candidatus Dojkabacteria bacterium]|nr:hypothetical protein [Candidatus Dojkabacteria bacterium]MDQ7020579.1 hypothetical protein [Candidatus Dojkabacteria bacterium]